jgi:hypothetical protein
VEGTLCIWRAQAVNLGAESSRNLSWRVSLTHFELPSTGHSSITTHGMRGPICSDFSAFWYEVLPFPPMYRGHAVPKQFYRQSALLRKFCWSVSNMQLELTPYPRVSCLHPKLGKPPYWKTSQAGWKPPEMQFHSPKDVPITPMARGTYLNKKGKINTSL